MHRSLNWGTIDTSLASNIEENYKTMIPRYTIRSLLGAAKTENANHFIVTSHRSLISWWIVRGVALGTKYSTYVPIISVRALVHEYQIRNTETSTSMTCFRLPSNFCAEKVMHLILGWIVEYSWVFHNSITSVGDCRRKWEEPPASKLKTKGQSFTHSLPLRDFAPTVRSFHANVLQKCPAPQEKAVAWRVYLV